MKVSTYSTFWNAIRLKLDFKGALDNWATFSDEIVIAVGDSKDDTYNALNFYALEQNYPVRLIRTHFDFENDPFAYGKTENAALQGCTGDLMIQQNGDERMLITREKLNELEWQLKCRPDISALFVPTIDLYGSKERYLNIGRKWYIHRPGLYRGPAKIGIKPDGKPDYNKTSTDELLDFMGNLVPTLTLLEDLSIESVRAYVAAGGPISFHLGFLDFKDRLDRSIWWKQFWEKATGGDSNTHPTSIEEMAAKEAKEHGLPLWRSTMDGWKS